MDVYIYSDHTGGWHSSGFAAWGLAEAIRRGTETAREKTSPKRGSRLIECQAEVQGHCPGYSWQGCQGHRQSGCKQCFYGKVEVHPTQPACREEMRVHMWDTPHHILGGDPENPGVWLRGSEFTMQEVCIRCGLLQETRIDEGAPDRENEPRMKVSYPRKLRTPIEQVRVAIPIHFTQEQAGTTRDYLREMKKALRAELPWLGMTLEKTSMEEGVRVASFSHEDVEYEVQQAAKRVTADCLERAVQGRAK